MIDQTTRTARQVLVVGASRGIGLAMARRFADDGHRVTATWNSTEPPPVPGIEWAHCNIADPASVDPLFSNRHTTNPFEVVVANAAVLRDRLSSRMSDDDFSTIVDVNLTGTFRVARAALSTMTSARWGRLVLISSIGAVYGNIGQANYSAAKAGLEAMARSLAREVGPRNVTVNVVSPGAVATELIEAMSPRLQQRWREMIPSRQMATPDQVASAVAFVASERARSITGTVLTVDGGTVA